MAQRRGWLTTESRKKTGRTWVYHWYTTRPADGRRVEHTVVLDAVANFPRKQDAWEEIARRGLQPPAPRDVQSGRLSFSDIANHYQRNGMTELAGKTQNLINYTIANYLRPRWGARVALQIASSEIEAWLHELPLSNPSKVKLRAHMSRIYTEAQRLQLLPRNESSNPVRWVRQTAESSYEAVVIEPEVAARIVQGLDGLLERTLVLLVSASGLRIGEALGLRWEDVDWDNKQINLRRTWAGNRVVERLKTRRSKAPVPLSDLLATFLLVWKAETMYGQPTDWVFASEKARGRKPRSASVLTADHLRPAAVAAGVKLAKGQRFGFHNLRHSLATFLVNAGTDPKTVQSLLRHSNITTTLGLYAHRVEPTMMAAQDTVLKAMAVKSEAVN